MEPRTGCLPLLLALIVGIGALFFATASGTSVTLSDPAVVEVPMPTTTPAP